MTTTVHLSQSGAFYLSEEKKTKHLKKRRDKEKEEVRGRKELVGSQ